MADVKIPVSAELKGVSSGLGDVEQAVARTARRLEKFKWNPIDLRAIEAELKRLERLIADFSKRVGPLSLGGGGGGAPPGVQMLPAPGGGFVPYTPPSTPTTRTPARRGGRGSHSYAPEIYDIGQSFVGGLGNGVGMITSYGSRGAFAGARDGGMLGGAAGLARGLGIGALALGAFKVGQGVNEGYEIAKERAGSLDALKRQMGDLGISFEKLKLISEGAAAGLELNSREAARLAEDFNRMSRGADRTPEGLMGSVRNAVGFSRAYGLDPGAGVGFFGGMRNIDPRQNNRELALLLAETIERSGMNARADEVMQAFQSFASVTSRMTLSSPNLGAFAGAYGSLMSSRTPGMTGDVASSLLAQANASVMRMGSAGEAGKVFTLTALSRFGGLDPLQAAALAEGGLFGTRRGVFGNSALSGFLGAPGANGLNADVTNFQALRAGIMRMGGGRALQLDAAKNFFGVSSLSQAAALMNMDDAGAGNLQRNLARAGISVDSLNASGIQGLAKLGPNATDDELRAAVRSGRQETEYTKMLDSLKALDDIKINTGDKLIAPINSMRSYLAAIAEKLAPDSAYVKAQKNLASDLAAPLVGRKSQLENMLAGELRTNSSYFANLPGDKQEAIRQRRAAAEKELAGLGPNIANMKSVMTPEIVQQLLETDRELGMPLGTSARQIMKESSFNPNAVSKKGAMGLAQVMPKTLAEIERRLGRKLNPMDPNDAVLIHREVMRENLAHFGNVPDALKAYNGGWDRSKWGNAETSAYTDGIVSTPLPGGHATSPTSRGANQTVSIEGTFTLQDRSGNQLSEPVRTRVGVPRGAGAQ